jgi:4-amino-4-deoxy-L-arabinose transferase-like glycosyltransferase
MEAAPATPTAYQPAKTNVLTLVLRYAPLVIALGLFLALTLHQLSLPGFYYDEALDLVPMLHVMRGEQPELLRNIGVGPLPVMLLDYMGSLGGYLSVPFMAVFGPGYVAARAQPIFFSCVTIVLAWLLARRWFGDGVAAVTALLLAVNPSFIWFSRQGISVTSVMTVFSLGSLLLLDGAFKTLVRDRKAWLLFLGAGILLGLGLWAKFLFFRWLVVLVVMGLVFYIGRDRNRPFSPFDKFGASLSSFLSFFVPLLIGFAIGAAPLLYYNLVGLLRDGEPWTLHLLLQSLFNPTQQFGVDNRNFFANLQKSIDDVRVFVDGSYFWYNGVPFSNVYAVPALLLSAVAGSVMAVARARSPQPFPTGEGSRRNQGEGRWSEAVRFFAVLAGILALVFLGAFTVTGLWSTHQFIMLPLPQIVIACAVVWLAEWATRWAGEKVMAPALRKALITLSPFLLVIVLLALPFSRDLWVSERHHETLATTGGSGRFSDAVYTLAGWLDENKISQPIALDWGIEKQVRVLTGDRVRPLEIFGYTPEPDDAFREQVKTLIQDSNRQYIVLWDRFAVYNRRAAFTEIANQAGKQVVETYIAHEKSGLPVYVVLQAK